MPDGAEVTRPLPVPLPVTLSATDCVGSVIGTGPDFPPPEQAESAAAATSADASCRVTRARVRTTAGRFVDIAERERARTTNVAHDRHPAGRSRPATKSKCRARPVAARGAFARLLPRRCHGGGGRALGPEEIADLDEQPVRGALRIVGPLRRTRVGR